jgi:tRNA-uridine 2-sulfurtransferase
MSIQPTTSKRVVVAMSGGVDSSVAAALLKEQGYDVVGVFLRLGSPKGVDAPEEACSIDEAPSDNKPKSHKQGCCSVLDAGDARRVAALLDIPFYVLNFQDDFGKIIDYFVGEYNKGRTPNPCVRCNDWLKFGKLVQYANGIGASYTASGHYARVGIDPVSGEKALMRGLDHKKDQSYVLFGMSRETLDHTLLPIGDFEKPLVRQLAEKYQLPTFNKPDSQEICFVPDQDYAGLVKRHSPDKVQQGSLVDPSGNEVARHEGHQHFTIGQRKGVKVALGYPVYVVDIDPRANKVTLGPKESLFKKSLVANQINLLQQRAVDAIEGVRCQAKIRYNAMPEPAVMYRTGVDAIRVEFDEPQTAITPGQAVVCYDNDVVLGGGWIDQVE